MSAPVETVPPAAPPPEAPRARRGLLDLLATCSLVLRESFASFNRDHGLERAATLAYYGFFAMIPLLLIVIFVVSHFIASSEWALDALDRATSEISVGLGRVIVKEVGLLANQRVWGVVTLVVLFWSVTPLTASIRSAFSAIFRSERELSFLQAKLRDALAVLLMLGMLIVFVLGQALSSFANMGIIKELPFVYDALSIGVRVALALFSASLFYVALSPVRLRFGLLFLGSVITAALLGVIGPLLRLLLQFNPNYGFAFGSLKAVFLVFLWVYYCFVAILFAVEIMANARRHEALVLRTLFTDPKRARRRLLSRFVRVFQPGDVIFREGDHGREMFHIVAGGVSLSLKERPFRQMKEGEYFGEMAMLIDSPRTATASATEPDTTLAVISQENFDLVLRENPKIVLSILKEMANRLKAANDHMAA